VPFRLLVLEDMLTQACWEEESDSEIIENLSLGSDEEDAEHTREGTDGGSLAQAAQPVAEPAVAPLASPSASAATEMVQDGGGRSGGGKRLRR